MRMPLGLRDHDWPIPLWVVGLVTAVAVGSISLTSERLLSLVAFVLMAVCVGFSFLRIGLRRQVLLFIGALLLFTFAVKVGYGVVNTQLLALLPSAYLGAMLVQLVLLRAEHKVGMRLALLDVLVAVFFLLDFAQILNPYLGAMGSSPFLEVGLRGFQQRSFLGLVYFLTRVLLPPELYFNTIMRILTYSIALSAAYAVIQQVFGYTALEARHRALVLAGSDLNANLYSRRAVGFLNSPFTFGLVSDFGVIAGIYLLGAPSVARQERVLALAAALLCGAGVFLSGSRSTYLALAAAVLVMIVTMPPRYWLPPLWRMRWAIIVVIAACAIVAAWFSDALRPFSYTLGRISSLAQILAGPDAFTDPNFLARQDLLSATWPLILRNPFGYGTGIFNGGSNPQGIVSVDGFATWVDNEFSSLALELGVVAVILLVAVVITALMRCRRAAYRPELRMQAMALAALVAICPVGGFGGQWLAAYPANVLFWALLGVSGALGWQKKLRLPPIGAPYGGDSQSSKSPKRAYVRKGVSSGRVPSRFMASMAL